MMKRKQQWREPGLEQGNGRSPAAQAEWRRMLGSLEGHENEHAKIARRWAPTFQERLLGQRESRLQQRFDQTLRKAKKEQKQFDRRTRHGQPRGVPWIPRSSSHWPGEGRCLSPGKT